MAARSRHAAGGGRRYEGPRRYADGSLPGGHWPVFSLSGRKKHLTNRGQRISSSRLLPFGMALRARGIHMTTYERVVRGCLGLLKSARDGGRLSVTQLLGAITSNAGTDLAAWALTDYPKGGPPASPFAHLPYHTVNVASLCVEACARSEQSDLAKPVGTAALVHDLGMVHDDVVGVLTDRGTGPKCVSAIRNGYPPGQVPKEARRGVFVLRLFDSLEAGSHDRSHRKAAGLPWKIFDKDIETREPRTGDWIWVLNAARRCLYGVVCDRVREDLVEPDLNKPFFEEYLEEMLAAYLRPKFPDMQNADLEDCIAEARSKLLDLVVRDRLREQGAVKGLLKDFAYRAGLDIVNRAALARLTDDLMADDIMPEDKFELEDDIRKIGTLLRVEEICACVLMFYRGKTGEKAAQVVQGLFRCPPGRRAQYLADEIVSAPEIEADISGIVTREHLKVLKAFPRNRRCTKDMIYRWVRAAVDKLRRAKAKGRA